MMEQKQLKETINIAIRNVLSNLHTTTLCVVTAVNEKTISCKPVINRVLGGEEIELPELIEVPPLFFYGGESYEAYPIAEEDYCLLIITERCFDRWYEGEDFKPPLEFRMHDYSDGFAWVAPRNKAGAFPIPNDGRIWQIGAKYKEGDHEHVGNLVHEGNTEQTGDVNQTGNQVVDGNQTTTGNTDSKTYSVEGKAGWSGTFPVHDGRTATVKAGLITDVS